MEVFLLIYVLASTARLVYLVAFCASGPRPLQELPYGPYHHVCQIGHYISIEPDYTQRQCRICMELAMMVLLLCYKVAAQRVQKTDISPPRKDSQMDSYPVGSSDITLDSPVTFARLAM